MECSGVEFILSNVDFNDSDLPFKFTDEMMLRAATEYEIKEFRQLLTDAHGRFNTAFLKYFEYELEDIREDGSNIREDLKSERSRYWVIAYNGTNQIIPAMKCAMQLIKPKLYLGHMMVFGKLNQEGEIAVKSGGDTSLMSKIQREQGNKYSIVDTSQLYKLKHYFDYFSTSEKCSYENNTPIEMYISASTFFYSSHMMTLSLFSIIESLIAHKPTNYDPSDSITRQIKNKINLLSKRFEISVNHKHYFGEIEIVKLFTNLYSLRSDIAHGQHYNFTSKEYKGLKSLENVNQYLDEVVRELIKLSIDDAELINDLKEC